MRVLVTGSRFWINMPRVHAALEALLSPGELLTVVHGDCPDGADRMASVWCQQMYQTLEFHGSVKEEAHPARWDMYGGRAGPIRNSEMVKLGADLCLAFLTPGCKGTVDCAAKAQAAGIPIEAHFAGRYTG